MNPSNYLSPKLDMKRPDRPPTPHAEQTIQHQQPVIITNQDRKMLDTLDLTETTFRTFTKSARKSIRRAWKYQPMQNVWQTCRRIIYSINTTRTQSKQKPLPHTSLTYVSPSARIQLVAPERVIMTPCGHYKILPEGCSDVSSWVSSDTSQDDHKTNHQDEIRQTRAQRKRKKHHTQTHTDKKKKVFYLTISPAIHTTSIRAPPPTWEEKKIKH